MSNRDSRSRAFETRLEKVKEEHKEELDRQQRKWEFRYNNQDRRLKESEETIKSLRKKIRELKKEIKDG
jgi:anti-sigma28 factor (negative regulator of flagellin synthesis)